MRLELKYVSRLLRTNNFTILAYFLFLNCQELLKNMFLHHGLLSQGLVVHARKFSVVVQGRVQDQVTGSDDEDVWIMIRSINFRSRIRLVHYVEGYVVSKPALCAYIR